MPQPPKPTYNRAQPTDQSRDRHSRRVRFLKVSLPLVALAIVSSLFLFSRSLTLDGALPFANVDVEDRLREPKMTAVRIATTSENGAILALSADAIVPKGVDAAIARKATGTITSLSGKITALTADIIEYSDSAALAALTGGVKITSGGYEMTTQALDVTIADAHVESRGPVQAQGPLGTLDAGKMSLTQADGGFVLVFKSGVRLVYSPQS